MDGSDAGDGSEGRGFRTFERARDAVRAARAGGMRDAVTVWIHPGIYARAASFELGEADGGVGPDAVVTYRAVEPGTVRIAGGVTIAGWESVRDPAVLGRLCAEARQRVMQVDLRAAGISDFGSLCSRGFARPVTTAALEVFCDGEPMTLARWPNRGEFARIRSVPSPTRSEWGETVGALENGFVYEGDRPKAWLSAEDVWVCGYWCYDWAYSHERVASLDRESRLIITAPPHGLYNFKGGQRYFFENVLEELDEPGEYYVDRNRGMLYFWPPESFRELQVSILGGPIIRVEGSRHLRFEGLTVESGRSHGIEIRGGMDVVVAGCLIRNTGNAGVIVQGGTGHRVRSCTVTGTGDGAIIVSGGDRKTLESCGHEVFNCHLHHYGRWSVMYAVGIHASGVGIHISHNLIHDAPHTGILYLGNGIVVEYNELYRLCLEAGDAGAIYSGRSYSARGNRIEFNYVHDIFGLGLGTSCVYMDDGLSGQVVRGNILCGSDGIWLGGGRDMAIEGNLFVECTAAIQFDTRNSTDNPVWRNMLAGMKKDLAEHRYLEPPYIARFPELAKMRIYMESDLGIPCGDNRTAANVCVGGRWLRTSIGVTDLPGNAIGRSGDAALAMLGLEDNVVIEDAGCLDYPGGEPRVREGSMRLPAGFRLPSPGEIGLVVDEYRQRLPSQAASLLALAEKRADGACRFRLSVTNSERETMECAGRLAILAPGRPIEFSNVYSFTLRAGESADRDVTLKLSAGTTRIDWEPLTTGLRPARLMVTHVLGLEKMPAGTPVDALLERAAGARGGEIIGNDRMLCGFSTAWDGDRLFLYGRVEERNPIAAPLPWQGSSIEICISPDGVAAAKQWFIAPAVNGRAGFWRPAAGDLEEVAGADWRVRNSSNGYEFALAMPLSEARLPQGFREFKLELILRTRAEDGTGVLVSSLCGSNWNPARFAGVCVTG